MSILKAVGRVGAWGLVLGVGAVLFTGLAVLRAADVPEPAEPLPVSIFVAQEQDTFIAERRFAGRLVPQRTSDLGFALGGRVVSLEVDDGEEVEEGQELARLDTDALDNREEELQGQRREVESALRRAVQTLQRQQELLRDGFSTQQRVDDLISERDGLRARLRQIDAGLRQVETDRSDSVLRAPFSGQITRRFIDEGAVVMAGQAIFRLNAEGALEARIGVPATYRRRVEVGERYRVTANNLEGSGVVTNIVTDLDTQTRTITVILTIDEDPGFVARDLVRMGLREDIRRTGIWVPTTALNESLRGLWSVYVVTGEGELGTIERRDVEIVSIEENRTYVRGTLTHGQRVVVSSPFRFVPGQSVRVVGTLPAPVDPAFAKPLETTGSAGASEAGQ